MIPSHIIDKVFASANIEDVVSQYVSLKKRGSNLVGLCPFHTERTPSFSVNPAKGIYKCFGCGKAGHAVNFIMEIEQCSYIEAIKMLAAKYNIEIQEKELTPEDIKNKTDKESMLAINTFANQWFQNQLWNTDEGKSVALTYLYRRGIPDVMIKTFQIGYSPAKSNALVKTLIQNGFEEKLIVNDPNTLLGTGLAYAKNNYELVDRFRDRVIFPIHSLSGKVVGFVGRVLVNKDYTGKYVNSPESVIYSKSNELFGLFHAKSQIVKQNMCYLVEGQMDVISMFYAGITNTVASGGTALTQKQIQLLKRFTSNITVLYDGDNAGIHASLRGIDMLLENGLNVKIILLPEEEDPDSLSHKLSQKDFEIFLKEKSTDIIEFKIHLAKQSPSFSTNPTEKRTLIKDILRSIALIPNRIDREVYLQTTAKHFDFNETILLKEVNNLRKLTYSNKLNKSETSTDKDSTTSENDIFLSSTTDRLEKKLYENFLNLMQMIVRYGVHPVFKNTEKPLLLGEYILSELKKDGITFSDPLLNQMAQEYEQHCSNPDFNPENYFKFHNDPDISQLAIKLSDDKYTLSKFFSKQILTENIITNTDEDPMLDRLDDIVVQLLLEVKETLTEMKILQIQNHIKQAQTKNEWDTIEQLLSEYMQYNAIKNQICKELGNRIITK